MVERLGSTLLIRGQGGLRCYNRIPSEPIFSTRFANGTLLTLGTHSSARHSRKSGHRVGAAPRRRKSLISGEFPGAQARAPDPHDESVAPGNSWKGPGLGQRRILE